MSLLNTHIIHVKGAEERKSQMLNLMQNHPALNYTFIEKGNISDLNDVLLNKYFKGRMLQKTAFVSCAYKHLLAIEAVTKSDLDFALILEDDISFYDHFDSTLSALWDEIEKTAMSNFVISLEDSVPKYIPKSERKTGQFLYKRQELRTAGAYLIDKIAAKAILRFVEKHKSDQNADWLFNQLAREKTINCYWAQPAIACQKSINGALPSLIDDKKTGWFRRLNFMVQKAIKRARSNFS